MFKNLHKRNLQSMKSSLNKVTPEKCVKLKMTNKCEKDLEMESVKSILVKVEL